MKKTFVIGDSSCALEYLELYASFIAGQAIASFGFVKDEI